MSKTHARFGSMRLARAIIFIAMITAFVSGRADIMLAGFLAAGAMVATRCISAGDARKSVDLPVLIAIAASFGVGKARAVRSCEVIRRTAGGRHSIAWPIGHAGSNLLRNDGPERTDQQQRRGGALLSVLPGIGTAAGSERAPVHHGRDPGRLVCLRLTDRVPDSHDGLRARRVPLHRDAIISPSADVGAAGAASNWIKAFVPCRPAKGSSRRGLHRQPAGSSRPWAAASSWRRPRSQACGPRPPCPVGTDSLR